MQSLSLIVWNPTADHHCTQAGTGSIQKVSQHIARMPQQCLSPHMQSKVAMKILFHLLMLQKGVDCVCKVYSLLQSSQQGIRIWLCQNHHSIRQYLDATATAKIAVSVFDIT